MSFQGAIVAAVDQLHSGVFVKASLSRDVGDTRAKDVEHESLEFQFNPEKLRVARRSATRSTATAGSSQRGTDQQVGAGGERDTTLELENVVFDTFETRGHVYHQYIKILEKFIDYDAHKHAPPELVFTWGEFTNGRAGRHGVKCRLEAFTTDYTMFLNDGTPVRAKVSLRLKMGPGAWEKHMHYEPHSPDHAKLVKVRRGQTLSMIAAREYDNPREWRRIADANDIDDPFALEPGARLVVPPIL